MSAPLRVATYNLYLGADLSLLLGDRTQAELARSRAEVQRQLAATAFPERAAAVAAVLVRARLDVIGLQEVCRWYAGGELMWDQLDSLLGELERLGEPYDVVAEQDTFGGAGDVVAPTGEPVELRVAGRDVILRRRTSAWQVGSTSMGRYRQALGVPANGVLISIDRGWCQAGLRHPSGPVVSMVSTHTEAYERGSRDTQRDELLAAMPAGPVVVVGDFNAPPSSVGMPPEFTDAWVAAGHDEHLGGTCCLNGDLSGGTFAERIDYVWVRGPRVLECRRLGADPEDRTPSGLWPSDHAGVLASLACE